MKHTIKLSPEEYAATKLALTEWKKLFDKHIGMRTDVELGILASSEEVARARTHRIHIEAVLGMLKEPSTIIVRMPHERAKNLQALLTDWVLHRGTLDTGSVSDQDRLLNDVCNSFLNDLTTTLGEEPNV